MRIRKVDDGDWRIGRGLSDYAVDNEAIEQNLRTRLLSWVGDCFFALQEGVDWRNRLDVGEKRSIEDEVKNVILQTFGVVAVNSVVAEFTSKTRSIRTLYNVDTIFSQSFQRTLEINAGVS